MDRLRAAVEAHEAPEGPVQWYVDKHCIDCDAKEYGEPEPGETPF